MLTEDPRHGTVAGSRAGCRDECCRKAINDYNQRRIMAKDRGQRLIDPTGTIRRLQALSALGWSFAEMARMTGHNVTFFTQMARRRPKVHVTTAAQVRKLYDELSMRLPATDTASQRMSVVRTQRLAQRNGWPPPLAWDDDRIDDPTYNAVTALNTVAQTDYDVDEAVVIRVLAGENVPTNKAEKREIMRRWLDSGRSESALCKRMKWREGRYAPPVVRSAEDPDRTERKAS